MLPGLAPSVARRAALVLITSGTAFGNMTNAGGNAAAFDGNTSQNAASQSARCSSGGINGYVGLTLSGPKAFGSAVAYGSNDQGYVDSANPSMTLNIRGKNGAAPSSATDGTIVGSVSFTDGTSTNMQTIDSTDLVNKWDHLFIQIVTTSGRAVLAELVLYEWA